MFRVSFLVRGNVKFGNRLTTTLQLALLVMGLMIIQLPGMRYLILPAAFSLRHPYSAISMMISA